jgi:hypothetical protein
MDPARIFTESLTPRPELENSQGQNAKYREEHMFSCLPPISDIRRRGWHDRFVPQAVLTPGAHAVNLPAAPPEIFNCR